jgi:hypothetical protein
MGRKKALRWDQLFHISIPEYDVRQALSLAMTNMKLDLAVRQLTQSKNPSTGLGIFQIYRQVGTLTQRHEYVTKAGVGGVSR